MKLTLKSQTTNKITFTYDKPAGAVEGYLYYAGGVKVSRTFNPNDLEVTFGKVPSGEYAVEAVGFNVIDKAVYPEVVTPPPPPPSGAIEYRHTYTGAQANPPDYGWSWGMQMGGVLGGTGPANYVSIIPDGIKSGLPSLKMTVAPDTYNDAIEGLYKWPVVIGQTRFYGMMVKFPTNWVKPGASGWGAAIAQPGYQGLANSTLGFFAHADHVQYIILTGEHTFSGTSVIREYNNSEEGGTWPSGPRIIPAPMQLGVWHELIFEVKWSSVCTTSRLYSQIGIPGHTRVWHRVMGQPTWNLTLERLNIPTLQWSDAKGWSIDMNGGTANAAHKFGLYSSSATFDRVIEHGNIVIGTTFDAVASVMP